MSRQRFILRLSLTLVILSALAGAFLRHQYLDSVKREREAYFISIHWLAANAVLEGDPEGPENFDDLIRPYEGMHASIAELYPEGLVYLPQATSFTLEEPSARPVSLFHSDRLIATDKKWPRWEDSGEYANKFPEEGPFVLPPGYE